MEGVLFWEILHHVHACSFIYQEILFSCLPCYTFLQTEVLTEIFSVAHGEFVSSWCSSDLPIREEDATLEYDPFAAAGWVLDLFPFSDQSNTMSIEPTFVPSHVPRLSYPHQRTSLLVKVLANLHCFVPDICKGIKPS